MKLKNIKILGIMSGTSLDGIDFAVINFKQVNNKWNFKIEECTTFPYSALWFEKLKYAVKLSSEDLKQLNKEYTSYLNNLIHNFISENKITNLTAIASHGHTILHNPKMGVTLQIGNLPDIKNGFTIPIVCDFRVQDVKLGGQGAPLVPIGDRLLFSEYDFCLNLGGFSNISFEENGKRIAFDISPVNTILNYFANKLDLEYDNNGKIASTGIVHSELLEMLNSNPFFYKKHPKSLGIEFVFEQVLPRIEKHQLDIKDILATYTEHIAIQIGNQLKDKNGKMIVTGGGAFNSYLLSRIKHHNQHIEIEVPNAEIINYKEALIFAFLGLLKLNDSINVLSSVTGATKDHSSGVIY